MTYQPKRILVTGGAGFIGSNFIRYMLETRWDIEIASFDSLAYAGNLANLNDISSNPRYSFVHADIRDREGITKGLAECDSVVHFAAKSHVDQSRISGRSFHQL